MTTATMAAATVEPICIMKGVAYFVKMDPELGTAENDAQMAPAIEKAIQEIAPWKEIRKTGCYAGMLIEGIEPAEKPEEKS